MSGDNPSLNIEGIAAQNWARYEMEQSSKVLPSDFAKFTRTAKIHSALYGVSNLQIAHNVLTSLPNRENAKAAMHINTKVKIILGIRECADYQDKLDKAIADIDRAVNMKIINNRPDNYADMVIARDKLSYNLNKLSKELAKNVTSISSQTIYNTFIRLLELPQNTKALRALKQNPVFNQLFKQDPLPEFIKQDDLMELMNNNLDRAKLLLMNPGVLNRLYAGNGSHEDFEKGKQFFTALRQKTQDFKDNATLKHEIEQADVILTALDIKLNSVFKPKESLTPKPTYSRSNSMLSHAAGALKNEKKEEEQEVMEPLTSPSFK